MSERIKSCTECGVILGHGCDHKPECSRPGTVRKVVVTTRHGGINYRDWCGLELVRLNQKGDAVEIVTRAKDGYIALARLSAA